MFVNASQQQSTSLRDRLTFTQYVEFSVNVSPERCADCLLGLEQPRRGFFGSQSIETRRKSADDVRVLMRRHGRGAYTTASFEALILETRSRDASVVRGKFTVSPIIWLPLVYWLLLSVLALLMDFGYFAVGFFAVIMAINFAIYVRQTRADYGKLQALVADALQ